MKTPSLIRSRPNRIHQPPGGRQHRLFDFSDSLVIADLSKNRQNHFLSGADGFFPGGFSGLARVGGRRQQSKAFHDYPHMLLAMFIVPC